MRKINSSRGKLAIVLAAVLATGCVQTPKLALGQDAKGWNKLPLNCNPKRDPAIERLMDAHTILPVTAKGESSYCLATVATPNMASENISEMIFIWAGRSTDNCTGSGCPVLFLSQDKSGKLQDATQPQEFIYTNAKDFSYALSKNQIGFGFETLHPCSFDGSECPQIKNDDGSLTPYRGGRTVYIYNPQKRVFE